MIVQPINRTPRYILCHALDPVIEGPAIPAIDITLVLNEEIGSDWMEIAGHYA